MTCHASAAAAHTAHSSEFSLQCSERDGARWFAQSIVAEYCFSAGMVLAISLPKPPLFTLSIILPEFLPNQIAHRWIFFRRGKSRWRVPRRQCRAGSAGALPLASKGEGRCQPPPPPSLQLRPGARASPAQPTAGSARGCAVCVAMVARQRSALAALVDGGAMLLAFVAASQLVLLLCAINAVPLASAEEDAAAVRRSGVC